MRSICTADATWRKPAETGGTDSSLAGLMEVDSTWSLVDGSPFPVAPRADLPPGLEGYSIYNAGPACVYITDGSGYYAGTPLGPDAITGQVWGPAFVSTCDPCAQSLIKVTNDSMPIFSTGLACIDGAGCLEDAGTVQIVSADLTGDGELTQDDVLLGVFANVAGEGDAGG
jgi:hypothetical protein